MTAGANNNPTTNKASNDLPFDYVVPRGMTKADRDALAAAAKILERHSTQLFHWHASPMAVPGCTDFGDAALVYDHLDLQAAQVREELSAFQAIAYCEAELSANIRRNDMLPARHERRKQTRRRRTAKVRAPLQVEPTPFQVETGLPFDTDRYHLPDLPASSDSDFSYADELERVHHVPEMEVSSDGDAPSLEDEHPASHPSADAPEDDDGTNAKSLSTVR